MFRSCVLRLGQAFALSFFLAACAAAPTPVSDEDGGIVEPPADGGAEASEDGGALQDGGATLADGGVPDAGALPPDAGRDDRVWAAPVFTLRAPSDLQDPEVKLNAYFTPTEDVRGIVLRELDSTRSKAHIAMFSIGDARTASKLLAMRTDAGVDVKILWDAVQADSNSNDDLYRVLVDGGVDVQKIRFDGGSAFASMHNKFAVLDDARVLTGSMNWSVSGFTQNHEHLVLLPQDATFPARYESAWQTIRAGGRAQTVYEPSAAVNIQFGPGNRLDQAVIRRIRAAQRSIYVAMFDLSNAELINELILARERGVHVVLITDRNQSQDSSLDEALECGARTDAGIAADAGVACPPSGARTPILRANTGSIFTKMHQKYQVYDEEYVIAGSYNWTNLATFYNHENIVEIRSARIAQRFLANFLDIMSRFDQTYTDPAAPPARYGLTARNVQLTLEVKEPRLRTGDAIFVGGQGAALGNWERGRAIPMTRRGDGVWEATITVPAGAQVEYKHVVKDRFGALNWEGGPKHYCTPFFAPAQQRCADSFRLPPEGQQ